MDHELSASESVVVMALKLIQPGLLSDVKEGISRLVPSTQSAKFGDKDVTILLGFLIERGLVSIYSKRRYILTPSGEYHLVLTGIRHKLDARRMYLLKETRRDTKRRRSDTRR